MRELIREVISILGYDCAEEAVLTETGISMSNVELTMHMNCWFVRYSDGQGSYSKQVPDYAVESINALYYALLDEATK